MRQVERVKGPLSELTRAYEAMKKAPESPRENPKPNRSTATCGLTEEGFPATVNCSEAETVAESVNPAGTDPMGNVLPETVTQKEDQASKPMQTSSGGSLDLLAGICPGAYIGTLQQQRTNLSEEWGGGGGRNIRLCQP